MCTFIHLFAFYICVQRRTLAGIGFHWVTVNPRFVNPIFVILLFVNPPSFPESVNPKPPKEKPRRRSTARRTLKMWKLKCEPRRRGDRQRWGQPSRAVDERGEEIMRMLGATRQRHRQTKTGLEHRRAARRGQGGRLTTLNFRPGAVTTLKLGHVSIFIK